MLQREEPGRLGSKVKQWPAVGPAGFAGFSGRLATHTRWRGAHPPAICGLPYLGSGGNQRRPRDTCRTAVPWSPAGTRTVQWLGCRASGRTQGLNTGRLDEKTSVRPTAGAPGTWIRVRTWGPKDPKAVPASPLIRLRTWNRLLCCSKNQFPLF